MRKKTFFIILSIVNIYFSGPVAFNNDSQNNSQLSDPALESSHNDEENNSQPVPLYPPADESAHNDQENNSQPDPLYPLLPNAAQEVNMLNQEKWEEIAADILTAVNRNGRKFKLDTITPGDGNNV